jgi:glycosyltransferase involved in cell wall biosynthesis
VTVSGKHLGLLPAAGGGIGSLAASGQAGRLIDYYLRRYALAFDHVTYFSYLNERLEQFIDDESLLARVNLVPGGSRLPYRLQALAMPLRHGRLFAACDVVRVFQATGALTALVARQAWHVPYVTTYGYDYAAFAAIEGRKLASLYLRLMQRPVLRGAAGVIVTTRDLEQIVAHYIPRERIHLIPNGVDTQMFAPQPGPDNTPPRLLFVGRLEKQKNLPALLEAVAQVQQHTPVEMKLVGSGSQEGQLKRQARQLGLAIEFAGTVSYDELPGQLNSSDVFVLPSFIEGHPKSLIEAMSCGLACVVSDCPGNRAVVNDEQTGLLFDPHQPSHLARQLLRILGDRLLARQLGLAARRQVVNDWDLTVLVEREITLLKSVAR